MVQSIVLSGLAIGCIYALIGIAYNVMFSASRVFSFTAGTLGMVGGILGSLFILRMGMPIWARLHPGARRRRPARRRHRDPRGAAGAEKPRPAPLRALHARARADGAAVRRDRMEHRAAAVPAHFRYRPRGGLRSDILAADARLRGRRSSGWNCSIATRWSATPSWRSPKTTMRRARSACRSATCASQASRSPASSARSRASRAASCCSPSSPTRRC